MVRRSCVCVFSNSTPSRTFSSIILRTSICGRNVQMRTHRNRGQLREDVQRRLTSLEAFMKGEVESMTNRVKTERTERLQALEKAGRELADTARALELKISNLDEQSAKDIRDLRQQLLDQPKALS